MNKPATVSETLSALEEYRSIVAGFAAREEELIAGHRTAVYQNNRKRDLAVRGEQDRHAAGLAEARAEFEAARTRLEEKTSRREARLNDAWFNSEKRLTEQLEQIRGKRILGLQHHILQAHRQLRSDLEAARRRHDSLQRDLNRDRDSLTALANASCRALGGFLRLSSMIRKARTAETAPAEDPAGSPEASGSSTPQDAAQAEPVSGRREAALAEMDRAGGELHAINAIGPVRLFRWLPPWLLLCLAGGLLAILYFARPLESGGNTAVLALIAVAGVAAAVVHRSAAERVTPMATRIAEGIARARKLLDEAESLSAREIELLRSRLSEVVDQEEEVSGEEWKEAVKAAEQAHAEGIARFAEKWKRALRRNENLYSRQLEQLTMEYEAFVARQEENSREIIERFNRSWSAAAEQLEAAWTTGWEALVSEWRTAADRAWRRLEEIRQSGDSLFPPWPEVDLSTLPPREGDGARSARFGELSVNLQELAGKLPADSRLSLPGGPEFHLPLTLAFPDGGNIVLESDGDGRERAIAALNSLVFRLLAGTPPGRLKLTLIDPVGLGQSFAGLAHLADYENSVLSHRIWTQREQIEKRLSDLNEHVEKVIQMYLRNDFANIAEYNEHAGNIAEKYHFVVIADFPANFSDTALKRLQSLVTTGPRCGVYTFLHRDLRHEAPESALLLDDLRRPATVIRVDREGPALPEPLPGVRLSLDAPPEGDDATEFVHRIGRESLDSNRVEVPFSCVAPPADQLWQETTASEVRVPIGRTGASKFQYLALGKGTRQHALFAGKTGSGKSNLFHAIITNLALRCSPHEVEFYLVDFKKGVEFKCYGTHRLPHARVVAIESDREFGLSVLQRVDDELRRRGDIFRRLGVQDMEGARAATTDPLPRCLLIIDEFQEFFTEDDRVAQNASVLLDRIVRQGRAFGIHVLLGSQTLGGAYSLARATLGQMVVRVALQCNEADAMLIMDDGNSAPRLLSRPGEGIYNDAGGAVEGNSPFQAVFVPENVRDDYLAKIEALAGSSAEYAGLEPTVFEGNAPADLAGNSELTVLLRSPATSPAPAPRIWLGAPNAIKGPTEAVFRRQSGNHLLIAGQNDDAILTMLGVAAVALAAQHPPGGVRIVLFDGSVPGTAERSYIEDLERRLPGLVEVSRGTAIAATVHDLATEMDRRAADGTADDPPVFLLIHGLQRHRKLRPDDEFSFSTDEPAGPGAQFERLIRDGSTVGIHIIASVDTYNNLTRSVSRKSLSEFEMRVLFQMSASDSASLIDSPAAGNLGMHRALFHHEHEGYEEVFRPYGPPPLSWWDEAARPVAERTPAAPAGSPPSGTVAAV